MNKILMLNKISKSGLSHLDEKCYEVSTDCLNPDGILLRSFNMHDMEVPQSLLAVARAGAGVNNIPVDKYAEHGIVVFNTPGANANAVKELVLCALLLSSRKIYEGIAWAQSLQGQEGVAKTVESGKSDFVGPEILGKKLGVVGLGAIGVLVAAAANSLGMDVLGYDPYLDKSNVSALKQVSSLEEIYKECDYITLHVPATAETKGMVNADTISKMKKGMRVLNFSRGELVNNADIKKALENGDVSCYVTDFPTEEVLGVKGIVAVPHLGASTPESEENCAAMAAVSLKAYIENGSIKNSVNYPNTELKEIDGKRVCVLYKNDGEGLVERLKTLLKCEPIANSTRDSFGYTVFDVPECKAEICEQIMKLENVVKVRVI